MKTFLFLATILLLPPSALADDENFLPLFNGTDLDGWERINCAESTFVAKDNMIVCSGNPTGLLRTARMYENFILEMEWRHITPGGNAGLFVWSDAIPSKGQPFSRAVEVQVMDGPNSSWYTTHGDIFPIWGARMTPIFPNPSGGSRCLPSEHLSLPSPQWNHYRVTCRDGTIRLEVNGKEVSGGNDISPRRGYIVLESEGSEAHFRNMKIQELPPSDPPLADEDIAVEASGFLPLYGGVDLKDWRVGEAQEGHWAVADWRLHTDGKGDPLRTHAVYGRSEVTLDARWSAANEANDHTYLALSGAPGTRVPLEPGEPGEWKRFTFELDGNGPVGLWHKGAPMDFANILQRDLPPPDSDNL